MYSSRYYPKKRRYHSSYSRKRIYGSSYQPGYTTQYQKYGRTVPLNSTYPSIPTELPTRQSQILQVEQLQKAGVLPKPELVNLPVEGELILNSDRSFASGSRFYTVSNPIFNGYLSETVQIYGGEEQALNIPIFNYVSNNGEMTVMNQVRILRTSSSYPVTYQIISFEDEAIFTNTINSNEINLNIFDSVSTFPSITPDMMKYLKVYSTVGSSASVAMNATLKFYKITI